MIPTSKKPVYYRTLDAWRALASLWVVMTHSSCFVIVERFPHLVSNPIFAFSMYGSLGVQIFFVISGYCISQAACAQIGRANAFVNFAKARVRRIYPPFLAACILTYAVALLQLIVSSTAHLSGGHFHHTLEPRSFLYYFANFTLTQIPLNQEGLVGASWSLNYEIFFYLIAGIFLIWAMRPNLTARVFLNGHHIITILVMCFMIAFPKKVNFPFDYWAQYGLGVLAYDLINYSKDRVNKVAAAFIVAQVLTFVILYNFHVDPVAHRSTREQFIAALVFSLLIIPLFRFDAQIMQSRPGRFLGWMGQFSYSLYLVHESIIPLVYQTFNKLLKITERTYIFVFFAEILASVAFARLFYHFIERHFVKSRPAGASLPSKAVVNAATVSPAEPSITR